MAVGYNNLSGDVRAILDRSFPDIGQTFYVIDSDFRTAAQGWTQSDATGPLDLFSQRDPGFTFYTPGTGEANQSYTTDVLAIQAGIDAMVDFRGDTLLFTPGVYALATAITLNVPDGRFVGPPVSHSTRSRATLRGTAAGITPISSAAAGDRMEMAFLQLHHNVALANAQVELVGTDYLHVHDCYSDFRDGTAAVTVLPYEGITTASEGMQFSDCWYKADGDFGAFFLATAANTDSSFTRIHVMNDSGTLVTSHINLQGECSNIWSVDCTTQCGNGGAITQAFLMADQTDNTQVLTSVRFTSSVATGANATSLASIAGVDGEFQEVNGWKCIPSGGGASTSVNSLALDTA